MGRRRWSRVRTDATSTEVQASGGFTTAWKWGTAQDVRDFDKLAVFFDPTTLVSVNTVEIVIAWSDDGSTIGFTDDDNYQQSDFNIISFTDGTFNPKDYTTLLTAVGGELVVDQKVHLVFPVKAGYCRIGVKANATNGIYSVRTQRLVA
jgi:hypothetical protein